MTSWVKPGAKCVCIDAVFVAPRAEVPLPIKNTIYTVARVDERFPYGLCVELSELPPIPGGPLWWAIRRFRPLITRTQEQDVRAIKSLLRDLPDETRLDRIAELLND